MVIDLGINRKRTCDFLLVVNSNFEVSSTVFKILTFELENGTFLPPIPCLTPLLGEPARICG